MFFFFHHSDFGPRLHHHSNFIVPFPLSSIPFLVSQVADQAVVIPSICPIGHFNHALHLDEHLREGDSFFPLLLVIATLAQLSINFTDVDMGEAWIENGVTNTAAGPRFVVLDVASD